jgi:hypothetical protein
MLGSSVTERMCFDLYSQQSNMFTDIQFSYLCSSQCCSATYLWLELLYMTEQIKHSWSAEARTRVHSIHALQIPSENVLLVRCQCNSHGTVATNVNGNICLTCGYCQRWDGKGRKLVSVQQPALVFLYVKSVNGVGLFDQLRGSQWP